MSVQDIKIKEIEEKLKKLISAHLPVDEQAINLTTSFVEDLRADSLDAVDLLMAIEEEFGIEIPDDRSEQLLTVQDAVQYIFSRLNALKE